VASDADFVEFVADQARGTRETSYRKTFGEYALYSNGKVIALVCDNALLAKAADAGRNLLAGSWRRRHTRAQECLS